MPYLVLYANGEEIERVALSEMMLIGRAPECEIAVRDILLSRQHCQVEPCGGGRWRIRDLKSRNGTLMHGQSIRVQELRDGDEFRIGRTKLVYHDGEMPAKGTGSTKKHRMIRPADPIEALASTVSGMVLDEQPSSAGDELDRPYPRPRPTHEVVAEHEARRLAAEASTVAVAELPSAEVITRKVKRLKKPMPHLSSSDPLAALIAEADPQAYVMPEAVAAFRRRHARSIDPSRTRLQLLADSVVLCGAALAVLVTAVVIRLAMGM